MANLKKAMFWDKGVYQWEGSTVFCNDFCFGRLLKKQ
jgi:hypothetical protein